MYRKTPPLAGSREIYLTLFGWAVLAAGHPGAGAPARRKPAKPPALPIRGTAIHFCSCNAPCQCMFAEKDMEGCELAAVYHLKDGGYVSALDHVGLDGLTFVAVHRPKALIDGKTGLLRNGQPVEMGLYLPKEATPAQRQALKFLYVEHVLSAATLLERRETIRFRAGGGGYEVEIPGILKARTEPMKGEADKQLVVDNVPFYEGKRWLLGRSTVHTYQDPQEPAWNWTLPNRNGAWTYFSWLPVDHGP